MGCVDCVNNLQRYVEPPPRVLPRPTDSLRNRHPCSYLALAMSHPPRVSPPEAGTLAPLVALSRELGRLEARLLDLERVMRRAIERVRPDRRESARNLVH